MTQRIEAGADRGHDLTFVVGGDARRRAVPPAPRGGPRLRRQPAGARRGSRRPRRPPRPDLPPAGDRHPGHLAGRRPPSWCCPCRCGCRRSRSSCTRPGCGSPTPTCRWCWSTPSWPRSSSREPGDPPMVGWTPCSPARAGPAPSAWERPADDPDRLAILQFTSGSTSDPKGVMLPHRTVGANLDAIAQATSLDPDDDVLVSWLPLYHDMGLVGLLHPPDDHRHAARARRAHGLHGRARPLDGVDLHLRRHATAGPNFSYVLAARALSRSERSTCPGCASRSTAPSRSTRPRSRPSSRPASATACGPAPSSPPSAWPRSPSPARSPRRCPGCAPMPSTAGARDRALRGARSSAERRRCSPLAMLGRPVPGLEIRVVDPDHRRRAARTARSASSRSAARR